VGEETKKEKQHKEMKLGEKEKAPEPREAAVRGEPWLVVLNTDGFLLFFWYTSVLGETKRCDPRRWGQNIINFIGTNEIIPIFQISRAFLKLWKKSFKKGLSMASWSSRNFSQWSRSRSTWRLKRLIRFGFPFSE